MKKNVIFSCSCRHPAIRRHMVYASIYACISCLYVLCMCSCMYVYAFMDRHSWLQIHEEAEGTQRETET